MTHYLIPKNNLINRTNMTTPQITNWNNYLAQKSLMPIVIFYKDELNQELLTKLRDIGAIEVFAQLKNGFSLKTSIATLSGVPTLCNHWIERIPYSIDHDITSLSLSNESKITLLNYLNQQK